MSYLFILLHGFLCVCELNRRRSEFYRLLVALYADMPQGRMLDGFKLFLSMRPSSYDGTAGSDVTKSSCWVCQILPTLWLYLQLLNQSNCSSLGAIPSAPFLILAPDPLPPLVLQAPFLEISVPMEPPSSLTFMS